MNLWPYIAFSDDNETTKSITDLPVVGSLADIENWIENADFNVGMVVILYEIEYVVAWNSLVKI